MASRSIPQNACPIFVPHERLEGGVLSPKDHEIGSNRKTRLGLSISQCALGLLCFGFGIGSFVIYNERIELGFITNSASGIWGGIWIFVTGMVGVFSAKYPKNGALIGLYIAFCAITDIVAVFNAMVFSILIGYNWYCSDRYFIDQRRYIYNDEDCNHKRISILLINILLLSVAITEFFVAIVASVYTCITCCKPTTQRVFYLQQPSEAQIVMASTGNHNNMVVSSQMVFPTQPYSFDNSLPQYQLQQDQANEAPPEYYP